MQILQEQIQKHVSNKGKVNCEDYVLLLKQFMEVKGSSVDLSQLQSRKSFFRESSLRIKQLQDKQEFIETLQQEIQQYQIVNEQLRIQLDTLSTENVELKNQITKQENQIAYMEEINNETKKNFIKLDSLLRKSRQDNLSLRNVVNNIQRFREVDNNIKLYEQIINQEKFVEDKVLMKAFDMNVLQNNQNILFNFNFQENYYVCSDNNILKIYFDNENNNKFTQKKSLEIKINKMIGIKDGILYLLKDDSQTIVQYNLSKQKIIKELDLQCKIRKISGINSNKIAYLAQQDRVGLIDIQKNNVINIDKNPLIQIPEIYDILSGICVHQDQIFLGLSDCQVLKLKVNNNKDIKFNVIDITNSFLINDVKLVFDKILVVITEEAVFTYDLEMKKFSTQIIINENITCIDADDLKVVLGTNDGCIQVFDIINASDQAIVNVCYDADQESIYIQDKEGNLKKYIID